MYRFQNLPDDLNTEIWSREGGPSNIDLRIKKGHIGRLPLKAEVILRLTELWRARLSRAVPVEHPSFYVGLRTQRQIPTPEVRITLPLEPGKAYVFSNDDGSLWLQSTGKGPLRSSLLWIPAYDGHGDLMPFPDCSGLPPDFLALPSIRPRIVHNDYNSIVQQPGSVWCSGGRRTQEHAVPPSIYAFLYT